MMIIAGIAAIIGGLIAGIKIPLLLLPLIYISKFKNKKDTFLFIFTVYALAIGYEFKIANIYGMDLTKVLSVLLPSLLVLDSGLKLEEKEIPLIPFIAFVIIFIIGWFVREVFVAGIFGALVYEFLKDKARRGIIAALISFSLLTALLVLGEELLNLEGGGATQVVLISSTSTLIALVFFWKRIKRVEFT